MLTAKDIREVGFTKAIGGYKQDEVDDLLDSVEEDYTKFEETVAALNAKIEQLSAEVDSYKNSQSSLQNILIEAQKLADKTIDEAKEKAALILSEAKAKADNAAVEAKALIESFDVKFSERKAAAERELEIKLASSKAKLEAVEKAAADAVKREQALYDKTRIEIAGFKNEILELYKKQIEIINKMPDCVAMDAARAAEAVSLIANEQPDFSAFLAPAAPVAVAAEEETVAEELAEPGFKFNDDFIDVDAKKDDDASPFEGGFFDKI